MNWKSEILTIENYHPGKKQTGKLKLSSNENPSGPSPMALKALADNSAEVHIYPPMISEDLVNALSQWKNVRSENVICGNGSDEIFTLCAAALVSPGKNAVGSEHSFSQYEFSTRIFGGRYVSVPMSDFSFDLEAIFNAITSDTQIVFLCSPNNPTGKIIPERELVSFLDKVPSDVLVVIDQAYREFVDSADFIDAASLTDRYPNILVTGTFSKIFGLAALRIGYGIASAEIIEMLQRVKSPFSNSSLALKAGIAALSDVEFLNTSQKINLEAREGTYALLDAAGIDYFKTQANFVCIKSPNASAADFVRNCSDAGITIRDLSSFGMPEYVRVTLWKTDVMEKVVQAAALLQ